MKKIVNKFNIISPTGEVYIVNNFKDCNSTLGELITDEGYRVNSLGDDKFEIVVLNLKCEKYNNI